MTAEDFEAQFLFKVYLCLTWAGGERERERDMRERDREVRDNRLRALGASERERERQAWLNASAYRLPSRCIRVEAQFRFKVQLCPT